MTYRSMKFVFSLFGLVAIALSALVSPGCGGAGAGGDGQLQVFLADAPDPSITRIEVDIARVDAHIGNRWVLVSDTPQTFSLFDLAQQEALLASTPLPAGQYTQLRLVVTACRVTDADGTHSASVPSGAQTGLKINIGFPVNPGEITALLLDVNVDKSLRKLGNGNYLFTPVIPAVLKVLSGTITGVATDGSAPLANAQVTAVYTEGTSYPIGTEVNTSSTFSDGSFKIWALLPGTYTLNFSWTSADGTTTLSASVPGVVVSANQNTDVGTVVLQ